MIVKRKHRPHTRPNAFKQTCRTCKTPRFVGSADFYTDSRTGYPREVCKACMREHGIKARAGRAA